MKIAIISGRDPLSSNDTDGANVLVSNLANYYANNGDFVDIFVPHKNSITILEKQKIKNMVQLFRFPVAEVIANNNGEKKYDVFKKRILASKAEADFFDTYPTNDYDRVHIIHMAHSFEIVKNNIIDLKKIILHPMMLGAEYRQYKDVTEEYIERERETLSKNILIQTPSKDEKKYLTDFYEVDEERIIVTPRGYNDAIFQSYERNIQFSRDKVVNILCANMVRPQKGQHLFIPFVLECLKLGIIPNIKIIGVNANSYSEEYNSYSTHIQKEIKRFDLENFFKFHEPISQKELNELMLHSDVAIYPSIFETFGKAPLESMVTGLPTIIFDDVVAFQEFLIDKNNCVFSSRSPESLAKNLENLLLSSHLYQKISSNGIKIGKEYNWDTVIRKMIEQINEKI